MVEAAKVLLVKQEVLYWLVHNEFIKAEKVPMLQGRGKRINRLELERFRQRYIFGTEVAACLGTSPRKAMSMLANDGFALAFGQRSTKCRQAFYVRTEELAAWLSSITSHEIYIPASDEFDKPTLQAKW